MSRAERFDLGRARRAQSTLASMVVEEDRLPEEVRLIAGADVAFAPGRVVGAVVVLDGSSLKVVDEGVAVLDERFPYVPTLLSFREAPAIISAYMRLGGRPDVMLVDGQGLAHPYRCGLASHVGVVLGVPTIGVAKSRLWGELRLVDGLEALVDPRDGRVVGAVLRPPGRSRPLYVSVGTGVSLKRALEIVRLTIRPGSRLPQPIQEAHRLATSVARGLRG